MLKCITALTGLDRLTLKLGVNYAKISFIILGPVIVVAATGTGLIGGGFKSRYRNLH